MAAPAGPPTMWCPSCGAEYVAGTTRCADCRVALLVEPPDARGGDARAGAGDAAPGRRGAGDDDFVELGSWPRLSAQILRSRLETAGVSVLAEWSGPGADATGTLVVPAGQAEFAEAVVTELDVDDEVPDTSPYAYVVRIEEHLAAAAELLDELRTRLDELELDGP